MSFYERHILPRVINCACSMKAIMRERMALVPMAGGRVVEIGAGSGLNFPLYDRASVSEVIAIEPAAEMRVRAEAAKANAGVPIAIVDAGAERLPVEDRSVDSYVCTFTLCTVPEVEASLAEARRVLKPGGRVLVCEHGLSPDAGVARWQNRLTPVWRSLAGGCHLNRPVVSTFEAAGFRFDEVVTHYLPKSPKFAAFVTRGIARLA